MAKAVALLDDARRRGVFSAAALGVQVGGERWVHVIGRCAGDPTRAPAITPESQFDVASLTKPMSTLTLLAMELSRGRIELETQLGEVLPDAFGRRIGELPLRLFLGHASGLPDWLDFDALAQDAFPGAPRGSPNIVTHVRARVVGTPLESEPGLRARYSDLGFMLLGWVLESLSTRALDERFTREIARPLGLRRTGYRRFGGPPARLDGTVVATEIWPRRCPDGDPILGEVHDDNSAALGGVAGHAGLFSTAGEVLTWAACWRDAALGRDADLDLDPRIVRRILTERAAAATTWRLGWDTPSPSASSAGTRVSRRAFGHLGFTGCSVWIDPEKDAIVVLLTNRVTAGRDASHEQGGIKVLRPALHDAIWGEIAT